MLDERPNVFFCYERPRPIFVAGYPLYGLFPDVITTHLGIYSKGEATVKSTTYFPKFQTFGWYKETGEIQMFYPSVYDPECMLLFITEPNGTYWELGKMLKEELVYRTGGVLMGKPFSDWNMAPPPEAEKGHVTTCRVQSFHEIIDVILGMTRETRERKKLKLSDPQENAQHRFGAQIGGKTTLPCPPHSDPVLMLGLSWIEGGGYGQETVFPGADHHHAPGGGSSPQSIEPGR